MESCSDSTQAAVCKEHGETVTYFCKNHAVDICMPCKLTAHRCCKEILDINEASKTIYSDEHCESIVQGYTDLHQKFYKLKGMCKKAKENIPHKKQQSEQKLRILFQKAESYLDKLETSGVSEIAAAYNDTNDSLSEKATLCDASMTGLQTRLNKLQRVKESGNDTDKLIEINKATKELKQYCCVINEMQCSILEADVGFELSQEVTRIENILDSLSSVHMTVERHSHRLSDTPFIYTGELKVSTETDRFIPCVECYVKRPDGRQFVLDSNNMKLKVFDANNLFLTQLELPVPPFNLVFLSDTKAIVSTANMYKLFYITISENLAINKSKTTKFNIGPMVKYDDKNIIVMRRKQVMFSLMVVNGHGKKRRVILKDNRTLFKHPFHLSLSSDLELVYVLDADTGIFGVTLEGRVVLRFQDKDMNIHCGLAVGTDCIYVGVKQKQNGSILIKKLKSDGEFVKDISFGKAYPLLLNGNDLVLVTLDDSGCTRINFNFISK